MSKIHDGRSKVTSSVSVIIPVYNGRAHLVAALRSVVSQDHPPDEIIVVDDGSSDGSADVVEEFETSLPIKLISQRNQGQSAARNHAAAIASGDLLAFLDQDDLWYPRHLSRLTRSFASHPDLGWAYSDFDEIDVQGRTVIRNFMGAQDRRHPLRTLVQFLSSDLMILPSASVVRARAFEDVGGFDPDLCGYEDDDLFLRLFRSGWRSEFVKQSLTQFRVHHSSSSAGERFRASRLHYLRKLAVDIPDDPRKHRYYLRDLVVPRLFQNTLEDYARALKTGDAAEARDVADTAVEISRYAQGSWRRGAELALMKRPEVCHAFLRVHDKVPSRIRPKINPALALRPQRSRS